MRRFTITYTHYDPTKVIANADPRLVEGVQYSDGTIDYKHIGRNFRSYANTFDDLLQATSKYADPAPIATWLDPE